MLNGPRLSGASVRGAAIASLCGLMLFALSGVPARSAIIGNKDGNSYKLTIEEAGKQSSHEVAAGGQLEDVCLKGCIVILEGVDDGTYRLPEGNEIVTIEEGVLFYDGAVAAKPEAQ